MFYGKLCFVFSWTMALLNTCVHHMSIYSRCMHLKTKYSSLFYNKNGMIGKYAPTPSSPGRLRCGHWMCGGHGCASAPAPPPPPAPAPAPAPAAPAPAPAPAVYIMQTRMDPGVMNMRQKVHGKISWIGSFLSKRHTQTDSKNKNHAEQKNTGQNIATSEKNAHQDSAKESSLLNQNMEEEQANHFEFRDLPILHSYLYREQQKEKLVALRMSMDGQTEQVEYSKADLVSRYALHARDVRFLDSTMRNMPSILVRSKVIIVNMDTMKAIISADEFIVFDIFYPHVQQLMPQLRQVLVSSPDLATSEYTDYSSYPGRRGDRLPFEFICLEFCLLAVTHNLEQRFDGHIASLDTLEEDLGKDFMEGASLMNLLKTKTDLNSFEVTLRESSDAIREVLKNDTDMSSMYLSEIKRTRQPRRPSDHDEMEMLLETYMRKVGELENEVESRLRSITLIESHIQIRLDAFRNALMRVELLVTLTAMSFGLTAALAGLIGMNLPNGAEQLGSTYFFWAIASAFTLLGWLALKIGLRFCRRRGIDLFAVEQTPVLSLPRPWRTRRYGSGSRNMYRSHEFARFMRNSKCSFEDGDELSFDDAHYKLSSTALFASVPPLEEATERSNAARHAPLKSPWLSGGTFH